MEGIHNRISQLITKVNISPSALSKDIGIQRSTLSHIVNGRNKPSLDLLQKLKTRYPKLSLDWLIMGMGEMFADNHTVIEQQELPLEEKTLPKTELPSTIIEKPTEPLKQPSYPLSDTHTHSSSPELIVLKPDGTYISYVAKYLD